MIFADLFTPFPDLQAVLSLHADSADEATPTLNVEAKVLIQEREGKACIPIRRESGLARSALSAPLVPLDQPFVEGQRYRLADVVEWPSRFDLYHVDTGGPWLRRHGVLMAIPRGKTK